MRRNEPHAHQPNQRHVLFIAQSIEKEQRELEIMRFQVQYSQAMLLLSIFHRIDQMYKMYREEYNDRKFAPPGIPPEMFMQS